MLLRRKIITILICLSALVFPAYSHAEEEIENLVDIFESNGKIIAIVEGKKTIPFDLRSKEKALWSDSSGYLGAFLTNEHFFVISTSSDAWRALPLRLGELKKGVEPVAFLSPYIALLATGARAVGFDAASNRFVEVQIPIHDEMLTAKAEKHVAVVITSSRVFGWVAKASAFTAIALRTRETIKSIKITSSKATVRTSERLLTFKASDSTWSEHGFN